MKKAQIFAPVAEAATGLALLIAPSLVGLLLLGQEFAGVAVAVARVTGIALVALGISCWPGPPLVGMLIYSVAVTLYLSYLGFAREFGGVLLWPAVALHLLLSILLGRYWLNTKTIEKNDPLWSAGMSAFGTKRTSPSRSAMSAFGGKADMRNLLGKCSCLLASVGESGGGTALTRGS